MATWQGKESRKRKKEKLQKGWKDLIESVSTWEELQEEEENYKHDLEEWSGEYWSEAGFTEAGNILEDLISEVIAFIELLVGTPL